MTAVFLVAWVVFPALTLLLATGAGLLVRRAAGPGAVPSVLVVPVGLALLVVIGGLICYYAALAPLAAPAFVVAGAAGLVLERDSVRRFIERRGRGADLFAIAAATGAWIIFAAPVVLSGKPGFTGYAHIVDTSYQFDLAAHFAHTGRSIPTSTPSAYLVVIAKYLLNGYPGAGQWTLGALSNLTPVDLSWLYQSFLAFLSAMSALSLYYLLGRLIRPRPWRALGAFIAATPNVLVAYGLGGGIKELSTSCFLLLSAALLTRASSRLTPGRGVLAVPVAVAATFSSLSLTTLPWLAVLGVGVCVTVVALQPSHFGRLLGAVASVQMAALAFILALPSLAAALKLLPGVSGKGPVDLGNLGAPIPAIATAGVWITGDVRFPQYAHRGVSEALAVVVLILAAGGLVFAIRRRAWGVAWLGVAGLVSLYYVAHRYGPWIQFKADCVTAPIALMLAYAGIGALMQLRRGVIVGAILALVVAAGVLTGNALLYHDTTLAPYARLHDLQHIGERFAGQGPTLTPEFEEYAEYYLRDDDQTSMVNGPTLGLRQGVNRAAEPGGIFAYDLNEFSLSWVESFRTIVMRRSPYASRPPSNYRLVYLSPYYEVWQRAQPAATVYAHLPLAERPGENDSAVCAEASALTRKAGPAARIAYMPAPSDYVQVDASNTVISGALQAGGGTLFANGSGSATREQPIPTPGTYDFFLAGSFGRPVNVSVDGRHVGTAAYQVSYPGTWLLVGTRWLSAGLHHVEIARGGISLHPGNGDGIDGLNRTIGPLVIIHARPAVPDVSYAGSRQFARICHSPQRFRWVEVVRAA
jgi:hypothetical protein